MSCFQYIEINRSMVLDAVGSGGSKSPNAKLGHSYDRGRLFLSFLHVKRCSMVPGYRGGIVIGKYGHGCSDPSMLPLP
jgi:hypothetical protein